MLTTIFNPYTTCFRALTVEDPSQHYVQRFQCTSADIKASARHLPTNIQSIHRMLSYVDTARSVAAPIAAEATVTIVLELHHSVLCLNVINLHLLT